MPIEVRTTGGASTPSRKLKPSQKACFLEGPEPRALSPLFGFEREGKVSLFSLLFLILVPSYRDTGASLYDPSVRNWRRGDALAAVTDAGASVAYHCGLGASH